MKVERLKNNADKNENPRQQEFANNRMHNEKAV